MLEAASINRLDRARVNIECAATVERDLDGAFAPEAFPSVNLCAGHRRASNADTLRVLAVVLGDGVLGLCCALAAVVTDVTVALAEGEVVRLLAAVLALAGLRGLGHDRRL